MNHCAAAPYEGDEKYIFISYSHMNSQNILPIIEHLVNDGYRVWFDEGIAPGSEWPESIATHLDRCAIIVSFISKSYLESNNCKREINFALSRKKPLISIFIEPVELPLGMEMQLSISQSIFKYDLPSDNDFFRKLYNADFITDCRGTKNETEVVIDKKEENPVQKPELPKKKNKTVKIGKKTLRNIVFITAIALSIAIIILLTVKLNNMFPKIMIGNTKIKKNDVGIFLRDETISDDDMNFISKMEKLEYIVFERCTFDDNCIKSVNNFSSRLNRLTLDDCNLSDADIAEIDFAKFAGLSYISLADNESISDISALSSLKALNHIHLDNTAVSDLSVIKNMDSLSVLSAENCRISDISALSSASKLTMLQLSGNNIDSVKSLENCINLSLLRISNNKLTNLDGLENAIRLRELEAADNLIENIDGLENCTILEIFNINNNKVSDISLLSKSAETLKQVLVNSNIISDVSCLKGTKNLMFLSIDHNLVTTLDPLKESTSLYAISAEYNELTSINGLEDCTELKYIYLAHNRLTDMADISKFVSDSANEISTIDLSNNMISNISEISNKNIMCFSIYSNPIESFGNANMISARNVYFTYTDDIDFTALASAFNHITIIDCPKDKLVPIENTLYKNTNVYSVEFVTIEEADKEIADDKLGSLFRFLVPNHMV